MKTLEAVAVTAQAPNPPTTAPTDDFWASIGILAFALVIAIGCILGILGVRADKRRVEATCRRTAGEA